MVRNGSRIVFRGMSVLRWSLRSADPNPFWERNGGLGGHATVGCRLAVYTPTYRCRLQSVAHARLWWCQTYTAHGRQHPLTVHSVAHHLYTHQLPVATICVYTDC